jgi:hypothetical protein
MVLAMVTEPTLGMVVALVALVQLGRPPHRIAVELDAQARFLEQPQLALDRRKVGGRDEVAMGCS